MNGIIFQNIKLLDNRRQNRREATGAEILLWSRIRKKQLGHRFVRQYSVGRYILDFYCSRKRLAIELDGSHHAQINQKIYDEIRTKYLNQFNIKVIRFWNNEVFNNIDEVLEEINCKLN